MRNVALDSVTCCEDVGHICPTPKGPWPGIPHPFAFTTANEAVSNETSSLGKITRPLVTHHFASREESGAESDVEKSSQIGFWQRTKRAGGVKQARGGNKQQGEARFLLGERRQEKEQREAGCAQRLLWGAGTSLSLPPPSGSGRGPVFHTRKGCPQSINPVLLN